MMGRFVSCSLAAALLFSTSITAIAQDAPITVTAQAQSKWKMAESDHFEIYSDGDDKYLTKLSGRLEAVHYLLKIATNMNEPAGEKVVKVKVYAVGDIADVARLIGDPNSPAAGYYDAQLAGPLSVIPRNSGNDGSFSAEVILFHEYAHHFMLQYQAAAYPAWYVEGFAELAGTASFERPGVITYGKAAKHREGELRYTKRYPAAKMVDGRYIDEKPGSENWGYGDAWALTHYLTFSEKRRGQLGAYLIAINAGQSFADAAKVFGNLNDLTRELNIYIDGGSFVYKTPALPTEVMKAPVIRPLTVAEAEFIEDKITMERLAKISTQEEYEALAKLRAEKKNPLKKDYPSYLKEETAARDKWMAALRGKVARFPNDPAAFIVKAHAECMAKDYAGCQVSADRALALQPGNWEAAMRKGQALVGLAVQAPEASKKAAFKDARGWLLSANKANPAAHEPLYHYYQSFAEEGRKAPDSAVDSLIYVVDTIPQIDGPRLMLAQEYIARNMFADARKTLKPLAYSPHDSVDQQTAKRLLAAIDEKEGKTTAATVTPAS
jgi:hypothetical protein